MPNTRDCDHASTAQTQPVSSVQGEVGDFGRPSPDSPGWAAQAVLAEVVRNPSLSAMGLIQSLYPNREHGFYMRTKEVVVKLVAHTLEMTTLKATGGEPAPILQDRLSFCWGLLRQADTNVWKLKKIDIPERTTREDAQRVFKNLLPVSLNDPLVTAILEVLDLESDASYLYHYWVFRHKVGGGQGRRHSRKQVPPPPLADLPRTKDQRDLRRVIWWCIRGMQERYVILPKDGPINIEFSYVVERVVEEIMEWCGPEIERITDLNGAVERQLNRWLSYSHLDPVLDDTEGVDSQRQLASLFLKQNRLDTKLRIVRDSAVNSQAASRIKALEAAIRRQEEEIRQQEDVIGQRDERIKQLEASAVVRPSTTPAAAEPQLGAVGYAEVRDFLRIIDSKYSLDTLDAIQLGQDSHLTLPTFVAHMFYGLRRTGLGRYPKEDEFILSYDESNLYDCDGFELRPGESTGVRVAKRGWAILARGRTFPVRRARVVPGNVTPRQG